MRIWIIHLGELLPIDGNVRLFRYGILAEMLSKRGHFVTRWAPTFIHALKKQRNLYDTTVNMNSQYRIELLFAKGYKKNISLSRIRFHWQIASLLSNRIKKKRPPEIILSALPTPEICKVMVDYGEQYNVPVLIDIRDLWPDIYLKVVPKQLQWLGKIFLCHKFRLNKYIFNKASSIIAVSPSYLNWGLSYANRPRKKEDKIFPLGYLKKQLSKKEQLIELKKLINKGVKPKKFICCFFGSFETTYDLETVINAAYMLEKELNNEVQFVLCGKGKKMNFIQKQVANLNNVILPGWVSYSAISTLLSISDVGLCPYMNNAPQSLPNKTFEYLSGSIPIISSLKGDLEKVLKSNDCGITYQSGDTYSLVSAIKVFCNNNERLNQMKKNAKKLFDEHYSADKIYNEMIDYLEKLAQTK